METDSKLLKDSFNVLPILKGLKLNNIMDYIDGGCATLGIGIPILGAVPTIRNSFGNISKRNFLKKCIIFMYKLAQDEINAKEFNDFIIELERHSEEDGYETITITLEKFNNINKAKILANLVKASAKKEISIINFLRVCNSLERVPYSDLKFLHKYTTDYFEAGLNESFLSAGLIHETGYLANDSYTGINYGVSIIGEEMLKFGMEEERNLYISKGEKASIIVDG